MSVIFVLVSISVLVAGALLVAFVWAIKNGWYEDTFSPSVRILFDNPKKGEGNGMKKEVGKEEEGKGCL